MSTSSMTRPTRPILAVGLGGVAGTALRLGVGEVVPVDPLPWATVVVNVVGAVLLGALVAAVQRRAPQSYVIPLVATGILGSFTTFSAFAVDATTLPGGDAVPYVVVSLAGGVLGAAGGSSLVHRLAGEP